MSSRASAGVRVDRDGAFISASRRSKRAKPVDSQVSASLAGSSVPRQYGGGDT